MADRADARLHYLDAMRSVLMLLGVVMHAANPYDSGPWQVKDAGRVLALDWVVDTLRLFRMPTFFVIAGFFAMYLIMRRPAAVFVRERMRRVVVPLIAMLASVNLLQVWFVTRDLPVGPGGYLESVLLPAVAEGRWTSHLWFLVCLAVYFLLTAALAPGLRAIADRRAMATPALFVAVLAAAVLAPLGLAVVSKLTAPLMTQHLFGLVKPEALLRYLPFFAVGMLLCAWPAFLERFARIGVAVLALAAAAVAGLLLAVGREDTSWRAVEIASTSLLAWMAVRVVFALFHRFLARPSRTFAYLSRASYSVYLFHHVIVIVMATWLRPAALAPGAKFVIVLATASLCSLLLHHYLVRRSAMLAFLFNGASLQAQRAPQPVEPRPADVLGLPARVK